MSKDKKLKAALVTASAVSGAIAGRPEFSGVVRAWASVIAIGLAALLSYLLNPKSEVKDDDQSRKDRG